MAEYCVDRWNKLHGRKDPERKFLMSEEPEFCEGCAEWKNVVIMERKSYYLYKLRFVLFPIRLIVTIILLPWRIIQQVYWYFQLKKGKR